MAKSTEKLPDEKDAGAVKKYFQKVYPDMDFERVYASDMKKMVKWLEVLKKNNVEIKLSESLEEEQIPVEESAKEEIKAEVEKSPKKKTTRKKKAE
jgi:hypothetical protein